MTLKLHRTGLAVAGLLAGLLASQSGFAAENECVGKVAQVRVIAQPMPTISLLDKVKSEFEQKWKTKVELVQLGENERRSRSRLDASTGGGAYQVYYVDEANVAEFASAKWIVPLLDYYPKTEDYADFLDGRKAVAQYGGTPYFAPFMGGGDLMMYRKDLLAKKGLQPPKTFDEMIKVVQALQDAPAVYGWNARGKRGSGMNVWRWTPFFRGYGGDWIKDGKPVFNSDAAVKATQTYLDLYKYAPPGSQTNTWSEVVESFRAGRVGLIIESDVFGPWMEDQAKSKVVGQVGYAPPPAPLPSAGFAHGFAISAKGNPTICSKKVAGEWIGWATSKEMESRRFKDGIFSDFARNSSLHNPVFAEHVPAAYIQALEAAAPATKLLIWNGAQWPEIGDNLGLVLEEIFTGSRKDIKASLDESAVFAADVLKRAARAKK